MLLLGKIFILSRPQDLMQKNVEARLDVWISALASAELS